MQDDQDQQLPEEEPATSSEYSSLKRQRGDYGEAARRNFEMHAARETARQAQLSQLKTAVEQGEVLSKNAQKRLLKLEQVLEARKELLKPKDTGKSALVIAAENSVRDALQRELEKQAQFKRTQQKKAEKEVRQVLLLQASAAEMAEKNRIRQEKEAQRRREEEAPVRRSGAASRAASRARGRSSRGPRAR